MLEPNGQKEYWKWQMIFNIVKTLIALTTLGFVLYFGLK